MNNLHYRRSCTFVGKTLSSRHEKREARKACLPLFLFFGTYFKKFTNQIKCSDCCFAESMLSFAEAMSLPLQSVRFLLQDTESFLGPYSDCFQVHCLHWNSARYNITLLVTCPQQWVWPLNSGHWRKKALINMRSEWATFYRTCLCIRINETNDQILSYWWIRMHVITCGSLYWSSAKASILSALNDYYRLTS